MRRPAWRGGGLVGLALALGVSGEAPAQLARQDPPELGAAIVGRVCRDLDEDGLCSPGEPGLPDIRLVLASGREVRTDAQGRYHFAQVDARSLEVTGGVHLRPGRRRLRVDERTLPPDSESVPRAATLEVPWASVVLRDFAVRTRAAPPPTLSLGYDAAPPEARTGPEGVDFLLAGHASPGAQVRVGSRMAEVDAQGDWHASVRLVPGVNVLPLSVLGTDGGLSLYQQRVDVVEREGGLLVVPQAPVPRGALRLPGTQDAEFAMLISDTAQRQGLGTEMLGRLVKVGQDWGLRRIVADILARNGAMHHVCRKLGFHIHEEGLGQDMVKAVKVLE